MEILYGFKLTRKKETLCHIMFYLLSGHAKDFNQRVWATRLH